MSLFKNKKTPEGKDSTPAASKPAPEVPAASGPGMPLFFFNPQPINPERHREAGVRTDVTYSFARGTNSIPVAISEFIEAAKFYPIAFMQGEDAMPVAIVGLEQENCFISEEGRWVPDAYIPAYVRKYPFVFMELAEKEQFVLCVDEGSPHYVRDAESMRVQKFFEGDKPAQYVSDALAFCSAYQKDHAMTLLFCNRLKELDLLVPNHSSAELASGRKLRLAGFQLIDHERFTALPEETILQLHREGFLPLIYYCFLSASNWKRLVEAVAARESV